MLHGLLTSEWWDLINSKIGLLVLGSGLGWLFLNAIVGPWRARTAKTGRQQGFRDEVEFRLSSIEGRIGQGRDTLSDVNGGDTASSLNPIYCRWELRGLIFAGWGKDVLQRATSLVDGIKMWGNSSDTVKPGEALLGLQKLRNVLKL